MFFFWKLKRELTISTLVRVFCRWWWTFPSAGPSTPLSDTSSWGPAWRRRAGRWRKDRVLWTSSERKRRERWWNIRRPWVHALHYGFQLRRRHQSWGLPNYSRSSAVLSNFLQTYVLSKSNTLKRYIRYSVPSTRCPARRSYSLLSAVIFEQINK